MIAFHTDPLAPLGGKKTGGLNVYVRNLSLALIELGHQVTIFTRAWRADNSPTQVPKDLQLVYLEAGPRELLGPQESLPFFSEFEDQLIQHFQSAESYDLVHAHYWMSAIAGMRLQQDFGIPLISTMHTLGLVKERILAQVESLVDQRILAERRALFASRKIIASTPAEEAELMWLYELPQSKIAVIPPGVDSQHFAPLDQLAARQRLSLPPDDPLILFVGRIDPIKGIPTLIQALRHVLAENPDSPPHLALIGGVLGADHSLEGQYGRELEQHAHQLGLSDRVRFLGQQDQAKLLDYYNAADVIVLPSHYESFGLVALEAMACGRPVIASRVGGLADLISDGHNGLLAEAGNPEDLGAKITSLLENPSLSKSLGANARDFAEKRTWQNFASQTLSIYKQILD